MAGLWLICVLTILGARNVKSSSSDWLEPFESILCPHDDPQSHTCYDLTKENRTCTVISFGTCANTDGQHHNRNWWLQDLCLSVEQDNCTVYKCQKFCCDGWTTDSDGRCDKPFDKNDITCEKGLVNWDDDLPKCECYPSFYGEKCDIPRCDGGCKNGGTCRVTLDGSHQCHCPPPFSGPSCETVTCLEPCLNGGTCVSNGPEAVCACRLNYYGKTCAHEIDGTLCPMPNNTCANRMRCRDQCINTAGCPEGKVCCNDGCWMKCVRPVTRTCQLDQRYYRAGEMFSKDACTHCTCLINGTISCSKVECPVVDCSDGELVHEDGLCCPVCRGINDKLPGERPTLSRCYQGVIVPLNLSRDSNTYYLHNLNIEAWDSTGHKLQVTYSPSSMTHCGCAKSERVTQMISVSAVDRYGGRTECNFWAYLLDPVPPSFLSCPADIYVYEDEQVTWDEPRAQDNVGIRYLWSNRDQDEHFGPGGYTVTYTAIDYDDNQATCEFNVYVYGDGTTDAQMPAGLKCRKKKVTVGIFAGTICGGIALIVLIIVAVLTIKIRRRRAACRERQHIHAVSNEQYGVGLFPDYKGSSTKPPDYTPPNNPPAYDEANNPDEHDYKFANPPLYEEISAAGGDKTQPPTGDSRTASTGLYQEVGGAERVGDAVENPVYGSQATEVIRTPRQSEV